MTHSEDKMVPVSVHTQDKIAISSSVEGYPYWRPLLPIVKFCLDRGGKFVDERATLDNPFYEDRNGSYSCMMAGPITIQDVLNHFDLPEHFEIGVPYANSISDMKHRCDISLMSFEDLNTMRKRSESSKSRRDKMREQLKQKKTALKNVSLNKKGSE